MITLYTHGKPEETAEGTLLFSADVNEFLEQSGKDNLLEVPVRGTLLKINGSDYELKGFTFGSDEPFFLECAPVPAPSVVDELNLGVEMETQFLNEDISANPVSMKKALAMAEDFANDYNCLKQASEDVERAVAYEKALFDSIKKKYCMDPILGNRNAVLLRLESQVGAVVMQALKQPEALDSKFYDLLKECAAKIKSLDK